MSQCFYQGSTEISDLDTSTISILVKGVINDDLSTNNCLEAVEIHFTHQVIGDITIEVVSPAGQSVTLVGPGGIYDAYTELAKWNVTFVQNSMAAAPDFGLDPIWSNGNTWLNFFTYTGSYYPYQGSLEDLNSGPVNGTWQIKAIDGVQFGSGEISYVELFFCNTEGQDCLACDAPEPIVTPGNTDFCEDNSSLSLDVNYNFAGNFDSDFYGVGYMVFKDSLFFEYLDSPILTGYSGGTYQVCVVSYLGADLNTLQSTPLTDSLQYIEQYFLDNNICANMSNVCYDVNIHSIPEVVIVDTTICQGDQLVINGAIYDTPGPYQVITPRAYCDSMSILNLEVLDVELSILSQFDSLSCKNRTFVLDASSSTYPENSLISWFTSDGLILSDTSLPLITIGLPGTYVFTIENGYCTKEINIEIPAKDDFAFLTLEADTLKCGMDSVDIHLIHDVGLTSAFWGGAGSFELIPDGIRVPVGGTYNVQIATQNGCDANLSIDVLDFREYPDFEISAPMLSCSNPEVEILFDTTNTAGTTYEWSLAGMTLGNTPFLTVSQPGTYTLVATNPEGCARTFPVNIQSTVDILDVVLVYDTIDCINTGTYISYQSSFDDIQVLWTLPDMSQRVDSVFYTELPGEYKLSLSNEKGCTLDTSFVVIGDLSQPQILFGEQSFLCGSDSIQLTFTSDLPIEFLTWTGPGFFSEEESPYVFSPGQYVLMACPKNGCCVFDTLLVGGDGNVPIIIFDYDRLDCDTDTVMIIPSDTVSYNYTWTYNGMPYGAGYKSITVTTPGRYEVTVTEPGTGCQSQYSIPITLDLIDTLKGIFSPDLDCERLTTTIKVNPVRTIETFTWTGPGIVENNFEPDIDKPGWYYLDFQYTNGCSGRDSILVNKIGEIPELYGENDTLSCLDNSITIGVEYNQENVSISWEGPDFSGTGDQVEISSPGIYTAYALAEGSCMDSLDIIVYGDTLKPQISLMSLDTIDCQSQMIEVSVDVMGDIVNTEFSGPGIVSQTTYSAVLNLPGEYSFSATSENGCVSTKSFMAIAKLDTPSYELIVDTIDCNHLEVNVGVEIDPDVNIVWSGPVSVEDGVNIFSTSTAGIYDFDLTNSFGCTSKGQLIIPGDTLSPSVEILQSNPLNCAYPETTLSLESLQDDMIVQWSGPDIDNPGFVEQSISKAGEYTVEVTGPNGCLTQKSITVDIDTIHPNISIAGASITCSSGKTNLSVDSDIPIVEYIWSGPEFSSTESNPLVFTQGSYSVTATAANGCQGFDSIAIDDQRVYPFIDVEEEFVLNCDDQPIDVTYLNISDYANIQWIGQNGFFDSGDTAYITQEGIYYAVVVNEEGCSMVDTFEVIFKKIPPVFSFDAEVLTCNGPARLIAVNTEDDRSVYWSGPDDFQSQSASISVDVPGTYTLTVTGQNGCDSTVFVPLIDNRIYPEASATINEPFACTIDEVKLSGVGSSQGPQFQYLWETLDGQIISGANTLSPRIFGEGTYIISVMDASNGCVSSDTLVLVKENQTLQALVADITSPSCEGYANGIIHISEIVGGVGPYQINVDGYDYGENTDIKYLDASDHLVQITDSLGCNIDTMLSMGDRYLQVDIPDDVTVNLGDTIAVFAQINLSPDSIANVMWSPNLGCISCTDTVIVPFENQVISIMVTDINGCSIDKEFTITVDRPNPFPFPEIFSPNGDGINDVFYLPMTQGIVSIVEMKIYDTWGDLLFQKYDFPSGDITLGWDGRFRNQDAGQGVYIVDAVVLMIDGKMVHYVGDLTLIR